MNLVPMIKYAWLTIKHKWFVFVAGGWLGVSMWRRITHDLSKFSPSELPHYGRQFFGAKDDPGGWDRAWLHHMNSNDHHHEYWILRPSREDHGRRDTPIQMSDDAVREMVADWMGAGRAYQGEWPDPDTWPWIARNLGSLRMDIRTRAKVHNVIGEWKRGKGNV